MPAEAVNKLWLLATGLLILILVISCLVIRTQMVGGRPVEISSVDSSHFQGEIYVGGAISNPGIYPLKSADSIDRLIEASGGAIAEADTSCLNLYIPTIGEGDKPQKIDINRAEAWLLEALPDIGAGRAQEIVEYRLRNGSFHSTEEIMQVPGIGPVSFEKIKDLITVKD
jgi:competence protein ComEA